MFIAHLQNMIKSSLFIHLLVVQYKVGKHVILERTYIWQPEPIH